MPSHKESENKINVIIDATVNSEKSKPTETAKYGMHHWRIGYQQIGQNPEALGSSRYTTVHDFTGPNAYHGPKVEDYAKRAEYVVAAAIKNIQFKLNAANSKDEKEKLLRQIQRLEELNQKTNKILQTQVDLDPQQLKTRSEEREGEDVDKYFKEKHEIALRALQELVASVCVTIEMDPSDLQEKVRQYVRVEGRDNYVHLYTVGHKEDPKDPLPTDAEHIRVSSATTLTDRTIPSSIRSRHLHSRDYPLSNDVRRSYGVLAQKNGKQVYEEEFSGVTHSSLSPIHDWQRGKNRTPNAHHRLRYAARGVEQDLKEIVKNGRIQETPEGGAKIKVSANTLFTSLKPEIERVGRKQESENRQLEESWLALQMFNGQKVKIDGKEYTVEVDSINVPSNITGLMGDLRKKLGANIVEDRVNLRSLSQMVDNVEDYMDPKTAQNETIRAIKTELRDLFLDFDKKDQQKINQNKKQIQALEGGLKEKYANLREKLMDRDYEIGVDSQKTQRKQDEIEKLKAEILSVETKLDGLYDQLNKVYETHYEKKAVEIQVGIEAYKMKYRDKVLALNDSEKKIVQETFDVAELNGIALDMCAHHRQDDPNLSYHLSATYNLMNYKMGGNALFFCKSAEDRTGRVGEKIEEMLSFRRVYGHYPTAMPVDQKRLNHLSHEIHEFSVNKQVTDSNDPGARGLQIQSGTGNQHLHASTLDDKMGKTAKGIFDVRSILLQKKVSKRLHLDKTPLKDRVLHGSPAKKLFSSALSKVSKKVGNTNDEKDSLAPQKPQPSTKPTSKSPKV